MEQKKQYCFEDWETGQMQRDFISDCIRGFSKDEVNDIGWLPTILYEKGYIPIKDFIKIDTAQKNTFFGLVDLNVRTLSSVFNFQLNSAYKPEELLNSRIEKIHTDLSNVSKEYLIKVYAGDWCKFGLSYYKYLTINDPRIYNSTGGMVTLLNSTQFTNRDGEKETVHFKKPYKSRDNILFEITVAYRFLEKLNLLKAKRKEISKRKDSNDYGTHQSNREWIVNTFIVQKGLQTSQNKTALKVKELYEDLFGLKIGTSTILRITGKY